MLPFMTMLLLGTIGAGLGLVRNLEVIQLARDAGRLFAKQDKNIQFQYQSTQDILVNIANDLGLVHTATGTTANCLGLRAPARRSYIFQKRPIWTAASCPSGATAACANYEHWVFEQFIVIGNTSVATSHFGNPASTIISSTDGTITPANYMKNPSAIANISGVAALPSQGVLYMAEATGPGITVPGFWNSPKVYSYAIF